ncbi:hypothetical protein GQ651_00135 [Alphaproteobacteria bacterium GH1-50]|uniref:Lipoprotein n=1 Tax=Kangsaoukella pontilimi TaxID=2691042 RepID=A0A7C9IFI3_9RHOB|nr:hypothetical protein [Kangsaoukella pontilimi]MXQ06242.1 hypothetical protein [Kangsaoukella pontilimi]
MLKATVGPPLKALALVLALSGCVSMGQRDQPVEAFDAALVVTGVAILIGLASLGD